MEINAKEILYSIISKMGKDSIESAIISNPSQIPTVIKEICVRCMELINSYTDYGKPKAYGDLVEALVHYLLTVAMIPSERKIKYDSDIEIDIVIPSLKQLKTDPNRALLISFPKFPDRNYINTHIDRLLKMQPNKNNVWFVFGSYPKMTDSLKGFTVFVQDDFVKELFKPLSSIMKDIMLFVETNKIKSFKIFRT